MKPAEHAFAIWKGELELQYQRNGGKTILAKRRHDGPLVVQKPLYPEGGDVCHTIVVHPPGGIAGGDELSISASVAEGAAALLTTPGAAKWYRSAGPWAKQRIAFEVGGALEWLPRETIVFDNALADLACEIRLGAAARYIGWDIVCLGRTGSGESFSSGRMKMLTRIYRGGKLLWIERAKIEGGSALLQSPAGLGSRVVFGTLVATEAPAALVRQCKDVAPTTALPGLVIARYLGDSTEEAFDQFRSIWSLLRSAVIGREAIEPRIWRT